MLILHGSATGTATDVAASLFRLCRRYHIDELKISSLEELDLVGLLESDLAVFVVSTTGNGDVPSSMHSFWSTILRNDLGTSLLEDLDFIVLGLGDSKYAQFNWTAKKLRRRLLQLGAHEAMDMVTCDDSAHEGMDSAFVPFTRSFEEFMKDINGGREPIPRQVLLPPICPVHLQHEFSRLSIVSNGVETATSCGSGRKLKAEIKLNTRLTPDTHFQDVRLLRFHLQTPVELTIEPGDVLSIVPTNPPVSVERFLELLHWQDDAETIVALPQGSKAAGLFPDAKAITLRHLITKAIPLHGVPSLTLFSQLHPFTTNEDFREKFDEWDEPDGKDDLYDYLTRPRRTLLEVVEDFASGLEIPIEYCIDLFGITVARSYSIAGARLVIPSADHGFSINEGNSKDYEVELLVAMVKYQTKIKEQRQGLASRYLSDLLPAGEARADRPDSSLYVTVDKPIIETNKMRLPDPTSPLLMICTGTGFAPLRFFIMHALSQDDLQGIKGTERHITLIFGCRSYDDDLVQASLPDSVSRRVKVIKAYSRLPDQEKQYVQDVVIRHANDVKSAIAQGGRVYLCGSSGPMPDSVRAAIDRTNGQGTVESLEDDGKWWQETW